MNIIIDENAKEYILKKGGDVKITYQNYHACVG